MKVELFVVSLAVYNIWYGAICWILLGVPGLILGSIFMVGAGIIGTLLRNCKFCETKGENSTHKE